MSESAEFVRFQQEVARAMQGPQPDDPFGAALRRQLLQRAQVPVSRPQGRFHLRPVWAILLALAVVMLVTTLILGPQNVLAAMQGWIGYIPGQGFVADGAPLRVLAEPVKQERDGVTLEVLQVLADSQQTTLLYRVDGLSFEKTKTLGEDIPTGSVNEIQLPNGKILTPRPSSLAEHWGSGYSWRFYFPPIPQGVDEFTLIIPILDGYPKGAGPEFWQVALKLVPAGAEVTMMPVQEIIPSATPAQTKPAMPDGLQLRVVRTVELEDGYLLQGVYSWDLLTYPSLSVNPLDFQVTAADGSKLDITLPTDVQSVDYAYNEQPWTIQVNNKSAPGPWTIHLATAYSDSRFALPFSVDLGEAPQPGQSWPVNQTFKLNGYRLLVKSVTLDAMGDGNYKLTFYMDAEGKILSAGIGEPSAKDLVGGGSDAGPGGSLGNQISTLYYSAIPTGLHIFEVDFAQIQIDGDWNCTWQPIGEAGQ